MNLGNRGPQSIKVWGSDDSQPLIGFRPSPAGFSWAVLLNSLLFVLCDGGRMKGPERFGTGGKGK